MKYLAYLTCLILTLVLFECPINAQIWLSSEDIYNEAEKFLNAEDYEEALPLFLLLEKKDFKTPNVSYKIGTCYLNTRGKKKKAIPYLEYAAANISSVYENTLQGTKAPINALLMLGVAYRINNQPYKAMEVFNMLKDSIKDANPELKTLADLNIKRCENAFVLESFPGEAIKDRLPDTINNEFSNFNPVLVDHGNLLYYMESLKFYDAIKQTRLIDGQWQTPKDITPDIHSDGDHYLASASADGNMLILYLYEPLESGELFYTEKTSEGWSDPIPFNENINTKYNETNASLSSDGKILFFTSNRPGGFGGLDIYMSVKDKNNEWLPAVNVGPEINTPYNEETPFISSNDSVMYFSSQGHLNIGGYDVFYSKRIGFNSWNQPINMGVPVSTADDDLFYYPMEDGLHGLMSRIEDAFYPSYDIYRYKYIYFPNTPRNRLKGNIADSLLNGAKDQQVYVIDKTSGDTVQTVNPDSKGEYDLLLPDGDFLVSISDKNGTMSKTDVNLNNEPADIIELAAAKHVSINEEPITTLKEKYDTIYLKDILFEFNNYELQPSSKEYLEKILRFMINDQGLQLKIVGYADALGNENYNMILSKKRAQSVANYFTANQIDNNRLLISGKGEKDPVAVNSNQDGTDNPEGRRYNRRVVITPINLSTKIIAIEVINIPSELRMK
jgi:outer membrane protein OmpA-like peptidoglycan-associated protein